MHVSMQEWFKEDNFYLGEEAALQRLEELGRHVEEARKIFIGYPCNNRFKLEKFIKWWEQSSLSKAALNDVGDPYTEGTSYPLNTHLYEACVLEYFAHLFLLKPHWGYVTSGGTQGNEQGLYMARASLAKYGSPILYFSQEAHYSIGSLGNILGLDSRMIDSQPSGEMDYEDLTRKLDASRRAIFSLSIGTTFKGAIDRIEVIHPIVEKKGIEHVFYHADAALFGGYLPFYPDPSKPDLNFHKHPYDSIVVSGHKFFGSPVPMGIFLIRHAHILALHADYIEYIHTPNLTIPCSRSSLNTLIFWWILSTTHVEEFSQQASEIIESARYFYQELEKRHYPVWLNPYSNTVYFKAPSIGFSKRWALALFTCPKLGPLAHIVAMQHVMRATIDLFLNELDLEVESAEGRQRASIIPFPLTFPDCRGYL